MQGVLKHRKLGSAEEQKSGVDIILSYLSDLPIFVVMMPEAGGKETERQNGLLTITK